MGWGCWECERLGSVVGMREGVGAYEKGAEWGMEWGNGMEWGLAVGGWDCGLCVFGV